MSYNDMKDTSVTKLLKYMLPKKDISKIEICPLCRNCDMPRKSCSHCMKSGVVYRYDI